MRLWLPHWVDVNCLAKTGWCVGNGAHHPLSFVKFADEQNRIQSCRVGKIFSLWSWEALVTSCESNLAVATAWLLPIWKPLQVSSSLDIIGETNNCG